MASNYQELRLQHLREALIASENSGQPQAFNRKAFKREMRAELGSWAIDIIRMMHHSMDVERQLDN